MFRSLAALYRLSRASFRPGPAEEWRSMVSGLQRRHTGGAGELSRSLDQPTRFESFRIASVPKLVPRVPAVPRNHRACAAQRGGNAFVAAGDRRPGCKRKHVIFSGFIFFRLHPAWFLACVLAPGTLVFCRLSSHRICFPLFSCQFHAAGHCRTGRLSARYFFSCFFLFLFFFPVFCCDYDPEVVCCSRASWRDSDASLPRVLSFGGGGCNAFLRAMGSGVLTEPTLLASLSPRPPKSTVS